MLACICAFTAHAQEKDVTRFLGIPVDGSKSAMIQKLKEKGFRSSAEDSGILEGEFNGTKVNIHIVTNNGKVYRIVVFDKNMSNETQIKIRFNLLCRQFENSLKYLSTGDWTIPEGEDIGYETVVHKKRYQAAFYQRPQNSDLTAFANSGYQNKSVWFMIAEHLGKYHIALFYDNGYNQANGEDL